MTFTRDNIVGVEFTVKGEKLDIDYKITGLEGDWVVITWCGFTTRLKIELALLDLNNGTWIVKNSKV